VKSSHLDERFRSSIVDLRQREGGPDLAGADERHIYIAGYVNTGISSTEIRRRVRDDESIEGFVSPRVEDYIEKYELYRR
jgi:nicotinic acid mononucleotide adenylyltransferase